MTNNINCTCGHSWSKASSSKKDMYVCHICGKDNTMEDGGWLNKFEQGGMNLEQKDDNYGIKPNPNDVQASVGPDFVGLGYDTTGRNYSPAWGGQFQSGGFLEPISYKLPSRYRIPYAEPSSELAMSIGGEGGEPAYLIPSFKGGKELKDPIAEYKKTGEHLGGPFKTWQEADKWEQEIRHPYVEKGKPIPTPLKRWGDMAMGGSLPGAVGFTYARTAGSAPSNGKYAKKTKASAQNGKEMKFYQEGLDFKPNSIAQDGGAIVDPMGQWAHPGEVTIIPSTDITMEGVDYPVLGISDTGDQQMMYPGEDYDFDGNYVTEYPMMKQGGWLSKFDTAQGGGTFMDKLDANNPTLQKYLNIEKNRSSGDMQSYFSEIGKAQQKPKNEKAIAQNQQKIKKQILAEAVANAKGKQATVKQDNRTSREKEIAQKQLLDLKMVEARGTSPFTQTLSSFTPTGSNEAAGQIFAEGVGQMTPMMGATRLFNTVRDPENNPYGIGQGNGFLANTLGTLGLLGDVFDVGAVTAPGVKAAGKYLTEQTPLKNAYKINPFAFEPTEGMMYRGLGVEGMEDALQSGVFRAKQYVEPSMVGNFDMSKRFDKAYFSPKFDVADQYGQGYIAEVPRTASDWGKRYGKKEWSQIAQRDIPITEGKILQKDWLRGYKEVSQPSGIATPNLGSAIEQSTPLKNISEIEATSPNVKSSWEPQELPGLHLSSTMEGGPISKIVEPKTGLVNVEQALGIIAKESGGASKASLIRNALGKDIPKKMDYNDFRKTVQDQLIPLDREVVSTFRSGYGTDQIGYTKLTPNNRKIISDRINNTKEEILKLEKEGNIENQDYLDILKANLQIDLKDYNNLPLENQTIRLSNKDKFGRGSDAHDNPAETLGHIHFIRDAESPDVLTMTQMQSDAFQGTHRSMPKSLENAEFSLQSLENIVSQRNNVLESLKKQKEELLINKADKETIGQIDEEINKFTKLIEDQNAFNKFNKAEVENFAQKSLLDKNHQERYLQELVDYAGKRGDVNKVRVPTSETAAKVQGYKGIEAEEIIKRYNEEIVKNPNYTKEITEKATENEIKLINDVLNGKKKGMVYEPEAQTILKKYTEQPKVIKKLFGVEPKIVTDSKGNTWYEFDIPSKFKGGKGEIKAFKDGGLLNKYQDGGSGLSRSNLAMMADLTKDIKNQKARNAQETVSQYTPKPGDQQRMNAAKDAYRAEEAKPLNRAASSRVAAKAMENIVEPMLAIETGMGASKLVKPALETAGKYLTKKTALKNAEKKLVFENQSVRGPNAYTLKHENNILGDFDLEENWEKPGEWTTALIEIDPKFQGKGFGKQAYIAANDMLKNSGRGTLHSSGNFYGDDAKHLWNSLVKSGHAESIGKDSWRFKQKNGGWLTKYK